MIRFSLLVVLTIALLSVAFRINTDSKSSSLRPPGSAGPGATRSVPSPSSGPGAFGPATSGPATSGPGTSQPTATPSPQSTSPIGAGSGSGATGQLPVTGWDNAIRLAAVACLLIGGGALTVLAARPRQRAADTVQD